MSGSDVSVDVAWIASHIDDPGVRLIEIDVSRAAYDAGHLPGAVLWNAYTDLRDSSYATVGDDELARVLARSGITPQTTVVVYGYGAPLGFWLLKASGHADVRILLGSRDQWSAAGHAWSDDVPEPATGTAPYPVSHGELVASREDVQRALGDPSQLLLDVRSELEFSGERFWPSGAVEDTGRAGRIPGAVSLPIDELRGADGAPRPVDELRRSFEHAGATADKRVIVYCTIGNRASEAWYELTQLLGHPDTRVYYGSWVEWGKAPDTPVET